MDDLLFNLFEARRRNMRLRPCELAVSAGYRNVAKFCRRWAAFQHTGQGNPVFIAGVARSLKVDQPTLRGIIEEQRCQFITEWNAEHDKPFQPEIDVVGFMALVHHEVLPPNMTLAEAEDYARFLPQARKRFVFIRWSSRLTLMLDGTGRLVERRIASPDNDMPEYMRSQNLWRLAGDGL